MARLALRRFLSPVPSIASNWFEHPVQNIAVKRLGDFTPSADGACQVCFGEDRVAFAKPRADQGTLVVANEKIASDLAFLLHLPVSPVVIRTPIFGTEWDRHTAMSLSCLQSARHWSDGTPAMCDTVAQSLEALRVFWTWIGDMDHNAHPQNLLYEIDENSHPQLLAIDHSYIWGQGGDPLTTPVSTGYGSDAHGTAAATRQNTVENIERLDAANLQRVVHRLVGTVLTESQADHMLKWLVARRDHLRTLLRMGGDND